MSEVSERREREVCRNERKDEKDEYLHSARNLRDAAQRLKAVEVNRIDPDIKLYQKNISECAKDSKRGKSGTVNKELKPCASCGFSRLFNLFRRGHIPRQNSKKDR